MPKRKTQSGDDIDSDLSVPLPIQTFFWRQTRPFIRPKLGQLCDGACISFERVVVQNILHGQNPGLCDAIQSVSRWKVIQVAFPHVMHACAALLENRKNQHPGSKFSNSETKLLYTLHWIILDAASECEDNATLHDSKNPVHPVLLHPLKTIQLFVYLFAPLVNSLEDSDFQSLKLENGLRLWQPLWDFEQPDIPCFATPVKPQRNVLKAQRSLLKVNTNAANIYIGKGTSRENLNFGFQFDTESMRSAESDISPTRLAPLARLSDSEFCFMSQSESQSVFSICEYCNNVKGGRASEGPSVCRCGRKDSYVDVAPENRQVILEKLGTVDQDFEKHRLASAVTSGVKGETTVDVLSASYFDVAILQCLFCLQWSDDGIYWSLRYIHRRLLEISDEYLHMDPRERQRSHSLTFADPNVLQNGAPGAPGARKDHRYGRPNGGTGSNQKFASMSPGLSTIPSGSEPSSPVIKPQYHQYRREPPFKKVCMVELRQYSDSTRAYVRKKDSLKHDISPTRVMFKTRLDQYQSPKHQRDSSGMYNLARRGRSSVDITTRSPSERRETAVKTSLSWASDTAPPGAGKFEVPPSPDHDSEISSQHSSNDSSSWSQPGDGTPYKSGAASKPIITITQETPQKSQRSWSRVSEFTKSEAADLDQLHEAAIGEGVGMARSLTDSNICYAPEEEVHEVAGSVHYIQKNGHLNYKVILQAIHFVAKNHSGEKICEVLLNIINCLLDLDIVERCRDGDRPADTATGGPKTGGGEEQEETTTAGEGGAKPEMLAFELAMDSLFSVYKSLGCPHGCGDGLRGRHGDMLRQKGHGCLQRLQKVNAGLFRRFVRDTVKTRPIQEVVDFFHAFVGLCVDPAYLLQPQQSHKKSVSQEALVNNGFANNFGHSIGGVGYRGVEGVLISYSMKTFVSRCVECTKELYNSDNISLFCDIRQLITYFKEVHGGTFRRVALSGLLDSFFDVKDKSEKAKETSVTPSSRPMSRTASVTSESGDEKDDRKTPTPSQGSATEFRDPTKARKSIFRKKMKKQLMLQQPYAASDSEIQEELLCKSSPRASLSAAEDDPPSGSNTPRRKFSKFHIGKGWRKPKSDHEEDSPSEPGTLDRRESKSESHFPQRPHGLKGKMSFKTASQATLTFLSARRRIEGGLKSLGKKMSKHDLTKDIKQSLSEPAEDADLDVPLVREKKMVDRYIVKCGMLRFSFLLECCPPGTVPDPQLVAAMLQLDAPVSARACLLLECALFVHRCTHNDWPNWMRLNLPSFRHSSSALGSRGQPSGYRRTLCLQKTAGRMFYSWAENLGSQLEYIMAKEHADKLHHIATVTDDKRKRQLRLEDDEEDFLDENTVNLNGNDCPYALKMLACLVLQEITTFLRESFQYLPRGNSKKAGGREPGAGWDKHLSSRRYSSIVSSPGHSDKSSESNIADLPQSSAAAAGPMGSPGERKISFAVQMERSDSLNSSTTSLSADPSATPHTPMEERKGRRLAQNRQKLLKHLRRGSTHNSSFRQNRSFRLRRQEGGSIKLYGSIRSRKVSSQSLQSDSKFVEEPSSEDYESMTMFSDEVQEGPTEEQQEADDERKYQHMPWLKVVTQLANLSNFICTHQGFCQPFCYERQRRSCSRLVTAVKKIYQSTEEDQLREAEKRMDQRRDVLKERFKRRESIFQHSSPTKRRESTPLLEKIKTDVSLVKQQLNNWKKGDKPKETKESIFQHSSPTKRRESTPLLEKIKTDVSLVKQQLNNWKKGDKPKETKEDSPMVKYISSQAQKLTQCPLGILTKAAPILCEEHLINIMPVAWELMMENDQELAAAAASMFLIAAVKAPEKAQTMVFKELQHEDTVVRINAVLRFGVLWKFRHQVWPRMEEGAHLHFKVPPPGIDFTLPSPTIGLPNQTPVDPPWIPHFKAKIEEVTVNQEQTKSLVTATTTRRKQQQEMIRKALHSEEERKRIGRERFPMTTAPVTQLAAVEPSLHHVSEEHEEALQEEINLAARRVSLAPTNRNNVAGRSMSWRNGSLHWARLTAFEGDEERQEHPHHMQLAQSFFPSSICAVVLPIIHLLDDGEVSDEGVAVSEVAEKVIWNCLVEDPVLFLRHFLEKLTHKDRHEELLFLLRKLVTYFTEVPSQMAHSLFNYLIGYVMFYVRTPQSYGQEAIAGALALLWQIVPSVEGIYFKDLKQTLKKEQCDPHIMISANVPSAKKIIVHGPDLTSIPSQFPIHEDTQFNVILQDSLDFFNIPEDQQDSYFLVDTKSNQIHNLSCYVRDFYFFRRNFYPQLSLVHMNPEEAKENLQRQAFMLKFGEIGKVLFTVSVLNSTAPHQMQNHISFLHEELIKLPAFPRKALDADFDLYNGSLGKELFGLDTLHKLSWVKLMHTMFSSMTSSFNWSQDLCLFLNVINGCVILHCEDAALLRYCMAIIINASIHFKHIFSMNGFLYVMPTLLRTYSNHQPNLMVCEAIQFVCKQFYILHRKPFMLQMFGSVSSILDLQFATSGLKDTSKVQPDCLFSLLMSLEQNCPDKLSILDIVDYEKPFSALDFCYENEPDTFNIVDVINMSVTVVMYAPDSFRAMEMLNILEVVLPRFLENIKEETNRKDNPAAARAEIIAVSSVGASIRALVTSCEFFTRSMSVPIQKLESEKSTKEKNRGSPVETSVFYDEREDSATGRHAEEGRGRKTHYYDADDEDIQMRNDFRKPRDSLLNVVAEFYSTCLPRLKELRKMLADPTFRPPELLDHKSHNRLAEIAHTLLKLAPYDPDTMACAGLQRYMTEILPITDWSQEAVRPGLNFILRRLDRLFSKISKKNNLKRKCDWDAAANLLKGVFLTLKKFPFIAHLPHLKTVINVLISIVLSSGTQTIMDSLPGLGVFRSEHSTTVIPPAFCSEVVKLVAMQMQALGFTRYFAWITPEMLPQSSTTQEQFCLEAICGGMAVFPTQERCVNMLVNFILPLCIRVGCGRRDTPKLRQSDINYALTVILNVLQPPAKTSGSQNNSSTKSAMHHLSISEHGRCGSISNSHKSVVRYQGNELLIQTAYLGLEVLMACFDKALSSEWHRVAKCIIHNSQHVVKACMPFWRFLDFVVTHRPSIFLMLQPFIEFKMRRVNCDTTTEHRLQQSIKDKLQGAEIINPKCTGSVLVELALELKHIRDEFVATGGEYRSRSATMVTDRSDYSAAQDIRNKNSVSEITAEIIGQPKPSLATIGKRASKGTILSQGSSNASGAPFKATVVTSSFDSASPTAGRRSSRRISALDGTRILEKFKTPTQEELSPTEQTFPESPKLSRKPTIVCRPPISGQNSLDEAPVQVLYENEVGLESRSDLNPGQHRLQRQDAKSRKTFKVKRTKTKPTSMRRFVSSQHRGGNHADSETESNSTESSPTRYGRHSKKHHPEKEVLQLHRTGTGTHWPRAGSPSNVARSVETISENMEDKKKPSRPRYIQRSRSHDDPHADIHAPAGTVRGRIARQGARIVRSRSPSSSPVRASPAHSPPPVPSVEPAEVPVNVTYAGIPGAGSPPASAQSLKESNSVFRYSLKKQAFKPREMSVLDSSASDVSPTSVTSPSIASPLSSSVQPDPFMPPGYDKPPKSVLRSPERKPLDYDQPMSTSRSSPDGKPPIPNKPRRGVRSPEPDSPGYDKPAPKLKSPTRKSGYDRPRPVFRSPERKLSGSDKPVVAGLDKSMPASAELSDSGGPRSPERKVPGFDMPRHPVRSPERNIPGSNMPRHAVRSPERNIPGSNMPRHAVRSPERKIPGSNMPRHALRSPERKFDGYDKPNPVVQSPEKKPAGGPSSLVKSRINMFTMSDAHKQPSQAETPVKIPPPIPPRTRPPPSSVKPPNTLDLDPFNTDTNSSMRFKSRDRQRPFSPPHRQPLQNTQHQNEPPTNQQPEHKLPPTKNSNSNSNSTNRHQEHSQLSSPSTSSPEYNTNPFITSPAGSQDKLLDSSREDKSGDIRQAYVASRCSSDESLTEFSLLLKDDEKSNSRSSVCIYFDGKDIPDTLV